MRFRNLWVLFSFLILTLVLSACTPTPKVSNFYMATDDLGNNKTSTFSPSEAFNLFFDVHGVPNETPFEARWYVLTIANQDPNTPFQVMDQNYSSDSTTLRFHLTNTSDWPIAQYRVDVYMSGDKIGEVQFSVSR